VKVLILGGDGYLGWPTAMYLASQGHHIHIIDSLIKKRWEAIAGAPPLFPTKSLRERVHIFETQKNLKIHVSILDIAENPKFLYEVFEQFLPDAIIHYAEQPSAPYSMMTRETCVETQKNNIVGTLNLMFACMHIETPPHIIKLGTMGEYGTPNIDIEEGWLDVTHRGRTDRVLYPKRPGSFYHLSKVHDSANLEFACRVWRLRVTDLNQGIVYGTDTDETWLDQGLNTAFHYDAIFGTVINRFLTQAACDIPLTVYGSGQQERGFIHIQDTLRCVELSLNNPAEKGEFRVFNQLSEPLGYYEVQCPPVVRSYDEI